MADNGKIEPKEPKDPILAEDWETLSRVIAKLNMILDLLPCYVRDTDQATIIEFETVYEQVPKKSQDSGSIYELQNVWSPVYAIPDVDYLGYVSHYHALYAAGRIWVFHHNYPGAGVYHCYTSAPVVFPGVGEWASPTQIALYAANLVGGPYYASVWYDGEYIYLAYITRSGNYWSINFRRGTPQPDGSISWVGSEETMVGPIELSREYAYIASPSLVRDALGYLWLTYFIYDYYQTPRTRVYVARSVNNDGTWGGMASGFPFEVGTADNAYCAIKVVPLTGGKVAIGYILGDGTPLRFRGWDGSNWTNEVTTSLKVEYGFHKWDMRPVDDEVCAVYRSTDTGAIEGAIYSIASNSVANLGTLFEGDWPQLAIDPVNGILYAFYHDYYGTKFSRSYDGGHSWEPPYLWVEVKQRPVPAYGRLDGWLPVLLTADKLIAFLYKV